MLSVVMPAYRAPTLQRCVARVLEQEADEPVEVIVCVSADDETELPQLPSHPRLRVLAHTPRLPAAAARNRAVEAARGETIVFIDADALAEPGWLRRLASASDGEACVAGAVRNGTPSSAPGTVQYLVEFLDLHPDRPPAGLWHGATCNLLVPRRLWDQLGPFPEDMEGGEDTLLTVAARGLGLLRFAPNAAITHLNRTSWGELVRHQLQFGCFTARLGRRSPYRGRCLVRYAPLAPLAFLARWASLYLRVLQWDRANLRRAVMLSPGVALAFGAWTLGLAAEGLRLDTRTFRRRLAATER